MGMWAGILEIMRARGFLADQKYSGNKESNRDDVLALMSSDADVRQRRHGNIQFLARKL